MSTRCGIRPALRAAVAVGVVVTGLTGCGDGPSAQAPASPTAAPSGPVEGRGKKSGLTTAQEGPGGGTGLKSGE